MMRLTLGVDERGRRSALPSGPKQRHRFVQDGDVPVIHLSMPRDGDGAGAVRSRLTVLEAALSAEQAARSRAEQSAQSALSQLHAAETKLAHAEMAGQEALAAERRLREQAEAALQQALLAPPPAVKKTRLAMPKPPRSVKEAQPVKWWLGKAR